MSDRQNLILVHHQIRPPPTELLFCQALQKFLIVFNKMSADPEDNSDEDLKSSSQIAVQSML